MPLSDNFFIYTDDPAKVLYRKEDGTFNWVRFAKKGEAEGFSDSEKGYIQQVRDLYNDGEPDKETTLQLVLEYMPKAEKYITGETETGSTQGRLDDSDSDSSKEEKQDSSVEERKIASKPSSRPQLMAKLNGIPPELADMFFAIIDGGLYIKAPGLMYMGGKIGYARIITTVEFDAKTGGYKATAKIYPKMPDKVMESLSRMDKEMQRYILDTYYGATEGHGTANKANTKPKQQNNLQEMAETRAVVRALRLYTGYGGTSLEELPDGEPMDEDMADAAGENYAEHYENMKRD